MSKEAPWQGLIKEGVGWWIGSLMGYPDPLRRVVFVDPDSAEELVFLTYRLNLATRTVASLYKHRLQI